jgi:hypothetical protein
MSDRTRTKLLNPIKLLGIAFLILLSSSACIMTFSLPSSSPNAAPIQPEQTKGSNPDLEREVIAQATNLAVLATQVSQLAADLEAQQGLIRYLATRGPALPPTLQVPGSPTPYLPLRGSLEIENGKCCVGGIAGESTMIRVALLAESPYGEVTGMRVSAGGTPRSSQALEQVPWQPYLHSISFEIPIATNWTGFYVQAQFKDALGNLSPVYIDDISVEGMPSPLTPTP